MKPVADLEGRANANVTAAAEKKGNHRAQRSKASSLVKKEVPPAADILSPKGRGKQHQLMHHQSQQKSNSGSNENNNNTHTHTNNDNSDNNDNINDVNVNREGGQKKEKLSVMLIEDDVPTLLEVQSMLLRAGATEVHTASSGKKALEFLDRDSK